MDYKSRKRLYVTPIARSRFLTYIYEHLEANRFPPPEVDLEEDITFFGNRQYSAVKLGYDQFFSYTKVYPLFDKRKANENRGFMADKWRNIHQQEQPPKAVPATTSQWYGRRPSYDLDRKQFARKNHIKTFFGKNAATDGERVVKYTEEVADRRI